MKRKISIAVCITLFVLQSSSQLKYEFRAAWIATVDNIDWPSVKTISADSQRKEFINLIEMHRANGLNAVIVQIRPASDAFYPSQYEPWSEWLTGKQGKPPSKYYDPLKFMIEETHKRGLEFHAWCNPYRAEFLINKSSIAPAHLTKIHPEWFLTYGDKKYFDPGNREAQQLVVRIIRDLVSRYNIDAIHFDDYFYPYRIASKEFPDSLSYLKYGKGMNKEDWRRSNVDSIILHLRNAIREENRYCKFGISPFGVWRNQSKDPAGSASKAGQTNYDDLYADILLWLKKGWIDYVVPQIYWEFTQPNAPFQTLLDWWNANTFGRHCYIGLGLYRAGNNAAWKDSSLIPRQIEAIRKAQNVQGEVYFSSKSFTRNPNGWSDSLKNNYYHLPALIPPMDWMDSIKTPVPDIQIRKVGNDISILTNLRMQGDSIKSVAIYLGYYLKNKFHQKLIRVIPNDRSGELFSTTLTIDDLRGLKKPGISATSVSVTNHESGMKTVSGF